MNALRQAPDLKGPFAVVLTLLALLALSGCGGGCDGADGSGDAGGGWFAGGRAALTAALCQVHAPHSASAGRRPGSARRGPRTVSVTLWNLNL